MTRILFRQAAIAAVLGLVPAFALAADASPDLTGTWTGQTYSIVAGKGGHWPESAGTFEKPGLYEKDIVFEITGQEGRRFWGSTSIAGERSTASRSSARSRRTARASSSPTPTATGKARSRGTPSRSATPRPAGRPTRASSAAPRSSTSPRDGHDAADRRHRPRPPRRTAGGSGAAVSRGSPKSPLAPRTPLRYSAFPPIRTRGRNHAASGTENCHRE